MHGSGVGAGRADVGGWQLYPSECGSPQPHSPRTVSRSGEGELRCTKVPAGTGTGERRRRAGSSAGQSVHDRSGCDLSDEGQPSGRTGLLDNYLIDNESCVIVGVQATAARLSQESAAARDMIDRYRERHGRQPHSLAADTTYGNGELLQWLDDRGITPYIRVKENPLGKSDLYGIEKFTYLPEQNCYVCPE